MSSRITSTLVAAIRKMAANYEQVATNIQLSFGLNEHRKLHCLVYAAGTPNLRKLSDLIGNNFYNSAVQSFLEKKIEKLAINGGHSAADTTLRAMINDEGEAVAYLYVGGQSVRQVNEDELKT